MKNEKYSASLRGGTPKQSIQLKVESYKVKSDKEKTKYKIVIARQNAEAIQTVESYKVYKVKSDKGKTK
jgi:hypothetical protein